MIFKLASYSGGGPLPYATYISHPGVMNTHVTGTRSFKGVHVSVPFRVLYKTVTLVYQAELLLHLPSLQSLMNVDWCRQFACNLKTWKFSDDLLTDSAFDQNPPWQPPLWDGHRPTDRWSATDHSAHRKVKTLFRSFSRVFFIFWTNKGNCVISFSTVKAF